MTVVVPFSRFNGSTIKPQKKKVINKCLVNNSEIERDQFTYGERKK